MGGFTPSGRRLRGVLPSLSDSICCSCCYPRPATSSFLCLFPFCWRRGGAFGAYLLLDLALRAPQVRLCFHYFICLFIIVFPYLSTNTLTGTHWRGAGVAACFSKCKGFSSEVAQSYPWDIGFPTHSFALHPFLNLNICILPFLQLEAERVPAASEEDTGTSEQHLSSSQRLWLDLGPFLSFLSIYR